MTAQLTPVEGASDEPEDGSPAGVLRARAKKLRIEARSYAAEVARHESAAQRADEALQGCKASAAAFERAADLIEQEAAERAA